jgi:hypothetical protein
MAWARANTTAQASVRIAISQAKARNVWIWHGTDQAQCLLSSRYWGGKRTHCGHVATAVFQPEPTFGRR